jgi:hypothetical protein
VYAHRVHELTDAERDTLVESGREVMRASLAPGFEALADVEGDERDEGDECGPSFADDLATFGLLHLAGVAEI